MGHSEMLLAVAGVQESDVVTLTSRLASGDWSSFPPEHVAAFRAAALLSRAPDRFDDASRAELREATERAAELVWLIAWGNYMTTVAEALRLPLERGNAFAPDVNAR
jgi:hypothetical protein